MVHQTVSPHERVVCGDETSDSEGGSVADMCFNHIAKIEVLYH